jgi:hypothetical protein
MVTFPFSVNPGIEDSLYDRLKLPELYEKLLSVDNLKIMQWSDPIAKHIINIVKTRSKNSLNYILTCCISLSKMLKTDQFYLDNDVLYVKSDEKYPYEKIFIPSKMIHAILECEHKVNNLNHPGVHSMIQTLRNKYFWPLMNTDIKCYVACCHICQMGKGHKFHKIGKLAQSEATHYGHTVHFDFAGPFWNYVSILIMICATTGAVLLHLTRSQTAETVVFALVHKWYPTHGLPINLVTDRGVIGQRQSSTDKKVSLNAALREHSVAV